MLSVGLVNVLNNKKNNHSARWHRAMAAFAHLSLQVAQQVGTMRALTDFMINVFLCIKVLITQASFVRQHYYLPTQHILF